MEKRSLETHKIVKALCCAALVTAAAVSLTQRLAVRSGAVREPSVAESAQTVGWRYTEGGAGGGRYSPLADINRDNVKLLKVAWTYRHGDVREASGPDKPLRSTSFEATPILVEGRLIFTTPFNRAIALDPETGAELWTFDPKIDRGRFLPVSTAGPDFYGGDRKGANLFSDSVVALDAKTGKYVWHFQTVYHDLWDYDLAAPPILTRVKHGGRDVDAVAQATKTGFVFLLDRETGKPLFPVEERSAPQSDVPGEKSWLTQPFPTKPDALVPQRLTEADLWDADQ